MAARRSGEDSESDEEAPELSTGVQDQPRLDMEMRVSDEQGEAGADAGAAFSSGGARFGGEEDEDDDEEVEDGQAAVPAATSAARKQGEEVGNELDVRCDTCEAANIAAVRVRRRRRGCRQPRHLARLIHVRSPAGFACMHAKISAPWIGALTIAPGGTTLRRFPGSCIQRESAVAPRLARSNGDGGEDLMSLVIHANAGLTSLCLASLICC
jgi:hypothetical protein